MFRSSGTHPPAAYIGHADNIGSVFPERHRSFYRFNDMGSMDLGSDYCYARVGASGSVLIDHLHQGWLAGVSVVFVGCCPPDAFREERGGRAFR